MKTLPSRPAGAGIVLLNSDGKAVCVKANYKSYWTFPGGKIDDGEHPKTAAMRETAEEVGIALDPKKVIFVLTVSQLVDGVYSYYFLYEAQITDEQQTNMQLPDDEIEDAQAINLATLDRSKKVFSKVVKMYASGERGYAEFEMNLA